MERKMIELPDRILDGKGGISYKESFYINALYRGVENLGGFPPDNSSAIRQFREEAERLLLTDPLTDERKDFSKDRYFIPEPYASMDVADFLLNQCMDEEEQIRVAEEYLEFEKRNLIPVLRFLIYLVDEMRKRNVVWGVGRGSSVASMTLFLIGITKVNPMKYGIDFHEFLR